MDSTTSVPAVGAQAVSVQAVSVQAGARGLTVTSCHGAGRSSGMFLSRRSTPEHKLLLTIVGAAEVLSRSRIAMRGWRQSSPENSSGRRSILPAAASPSRPLAERWLESNPGKRGSTLGRDKSAIDVHIVSAIGARRIGSVRQPDIQQIVNEWSRRLAAKAVERTYGTLRAMFAYAVNADMLGRSPCRNVNLPEGRVRKPRFLSQEEIAAIAAAMDERYAVMVWIAALLGLRWGEVAAMRVGSLDVLGLRLAVTEAVSRNVHGRSVVDSPKSAAGVRAMAHPDVLANALTAHMARMGLTAAQPMRCCSVEVGLASQLLEFPAAHLAQGG